MYYNNYSYWQIRHIVEEWGYELESIHLYKNHNRLYHIKDKDGNIIVRRISIKQLRIILTDLCYPIDYEPQVRIRKGKIHLYI